MSANTNYSNGYLRTLKVAGVLAGNHENTYSSQGAVGGMAAGSVLGGRLGESLAKRTRREVLGVPIPFTEKVDPNTAHTVGSVIGALGGGYLGHQYGALTGKGRDQELQHKYPQPSQVHQAPQYTREQLMQLAQGYRGMG